MVLKRKKLIAAAAVVAIAAGGAGASFAAAGGDDDDGEKSATGPGADRARAAALAILDGGTANEVERDGENGATWEVEVTRTDGKTVDVRLDERYEVVVIESDAEDGADKADGADGEK